MKRLLALAGLAGALALPACGGGLGSALGIPALPTPTPAPVLSVTPPSAALSLSAAGNMPKAVTITASENSSFPTYTAASNDVTIATVAPVPGSQNAFVITAVKLGSTKVHVSDANGIGIDVVVTVSP